MHFSPDTAVTRNLNQSTHAANYMTAHTKVWFSHKFFSKNLWSLFSPKSNDTFTHPFSAKLITEPLITLPTSFKYYVHNSRQKTADQHDDWSTLQTHNTWRNVSTISRSECIEQRQNWPTYKITGRTECHIDVNVSLTETTVTHISLLQVKIMSL